MCILEESEHREIIIRIDHLSLFQFLPQLTQNSRLFSSISQCHQHIFSHKNKSQYLASLIYQVSPSNLFLM